MARVRVYEIARDLKMESKALVQRLKDMGIEVNSHQSTLSADHVLRIKKELGSGEAPGAKASTRKVIRRRRSSADEASASADAKVVEGVKAVDDVKESTPKVESVKPEVKLESKPKPDAVVDAGGSESKKVAETVDAPKADKVEDAKVKASSKKEEAKPVAAQKPSSESASVVKRSTGATIVRKADRSAPREQQDRRPKPRSDSRYGDRSESGRGPRPDNRGPRPDGRGPARPDNRGPRPDGRGPARPDNRGPRPDGRGPARPDNRGPRPDGRGPARPDNRGPRPDNRGPRPDGRGTDKPAFIQPAAEPMLEKSEFRRSKDRKKKTEEHDDFAAKKAKVAEKKSTGFDRKRGQKKVYTPSPSQRRRDLKRRKDLKKTEITVPKASLRVVKIGNQVTVGELAKQLSVKSGEVIKKLMGMGVMATINQEIDFDTATIVAGEYNYEVKTNLVKLDDILSEKKVEMEKAEQLPRSPIVTIMGHVDHGKTSILDALRKGNVASKEAGGITQHIGAYTVEKDGKSVAFLDTPGHEAFSAMRSRGAQVTDIIILVVAADDGVMPQTIEAISHAKAAGVPVIVAVNKMDKPNINIDRIFTELMEHGVQPEEWGGDVQFVKVSALQGTGLEELLDSINLQAEMLELTAPVDVPGVGVVVEAHLDKGRGPVATVMVQSGSMKTGEFIVAGSAYGRVRAMVDHLGGRKKLVGPSTPVEIIGLSSVPKAGDQVDVVADEKTARQVSEWREKKIAMSNEGKSSAASLDELLSKVKNADMIEVPVIIKADTQGSVEAISEAVDKLATDKVRNKIIHKAVGGVNESDLSLAETSGAVVIAFNVRAIRGLDDMAEKKGVLIEYYSVIYNIIDSLKAIMAGRLPSIKKEVVEGHSEVRQTIKVPKIGLVAGCAVLDGKVTRSSQLRLIRDNVVIFSGRIGSLRRFKDDVKEVVQGYECGIGVEGYNDVREGDIIESFTIEEEAATL